MDDPRIPSEQSPDVSDTGRDVFELYGHMMLAEGRISPERLQQALDAYKEVDRE